MQKLNYVQSDEISLIFNNESSEDNLMFSGKNQKLVSILTSAYTAEFHKFFLDNSNSYYSRLIIEKRPTFDCKIFQVPSKWESINYLIARQIVFETQFTC